jgi:hypothetical protein
MLVPMLINKHNKAVHQQCGMGHRCCCLPAFGAEAAGAWAIIDMEVAGVDSQAGLSSWV